MKNKIMLTILTFFVLLMLCFTDTAFAKDINPTDYTYTITPILEPFNEYFFVKTDNPDPESFRFVDKSTIYTECSYICADHNTYADIKYENKKTGRVNGGYIFRIYGNDTDGGRVVLQTKNEASYGVDETWSDTKIKLKLPKLKDKVDYLIDTYSVDADFFDKMDAIEAGFSSICLYSKSNVRGELYKARSFWSLSSSPHRDQVCYIQTPYERKNAKLLFASSVYPFIFDSLGFPNMMGTIAMRLESSVTYERSEFRHCDIYVTYKGRTETYGGAGIGEGKGISKDKIKHYFKFDTNGTNSTLENIRKLLDEYSAIKMNDDVPKKNALTFRKVYDKVGKGSWVRWTEIDKSFDVSVGYTYLYQHDIWEGFDETDVGNTGGKLYWHGDLGCASNIWIDGRYIGERECFIPGEKYEDHPTSNVLLRKVIIPQISYDTTDDSNNEKFECYNIKITEEKKDVIFYYSYDENMWKVDNIAFNDGCANYSEIVELVENGVIDKKYLDMVTLNEKEVKALKVDRNTNKLPKDYLIYDGTTEPGTSLKEHKHNYTNLECIVCGKKEQVQVKKSKTLYLSNTNAVKLKWKKISDVTGYKIYRYDSSRKKWKTIKTINKSNVLSYTDKGLKNGRTYKYKIRAFIKNNQDIYYGSYSKVFTATIKPSKLKVTKIDKSKHNVKIYWRKVACSGYRIQRYDNNKKKWKEIKSVKSKITSCKIAGLKENTSYKFRICAYKSNGKKKICGPWKVITI